MSSKGCHHTEEAKRLISLANKGRIRTAKERLKVSEGTKKAMATLSPEVKERIRTAPKGHQGYWDTHPMPPEMIEKIRAAALADTIGRSERRRGKNNPMYGMVGKLNPNWRGGYKSHYSVEYWRKRDYILKRDEYLCQLCFQPAVLVHHIDWDTWNNKEENLVAFCKACNALPRRKQPQELLLVRAAKGIAKTKAQKAIKEIFG